MWESMQAKDPQRVGGKAAGLARLRAAGFDVPSWFVLPADALDESGLRPQARDSIAKALADLGDCPHGYAVRSSAIDEDGAAHSFAGQLDTYLGVAACDVPTRALEVWRSAQGERAGAYRAQHGLRASAPPAVIVQRMVDCTSAGVAFSADPVTRRREVSVVSAVRGTGEALVHGDVAGDTWHVACGKIVDAQSEGTPVLTEAQVAEVAQLARHIAEAFDAPQDIEWAYEGNRLLALQARPITTPLRPAGRLRLWDDSNIAESYPGVSTPLTFSFLRCAYEEVYRTFARVMGVAPSVIASSGHVFRNMLGYHRGRVFYNLESWYRVVAMLPGYQSNQAHMEQMLGVDQRLPASMRVDVDTSMGARWRDRCRAWKMKARMVWNLLTLKRRVRKYRTRLDQALSFHRPASDLSADELVARYRAMSEQLLRHWDAPIVNDFFGMVFHGVTRRLTKRWCDDEAGAIASGLMAGAGDVISADPVAHVAALADRVRASRASSMEAAVALDPAFGVALEAYLASFGDRCVEELKLESVTLRDDPTPLWRAVAEQASRPVLRTKPEDTARRLRHAAEDSMRAALGGHPIRRWLVGTLARNARRRLRGRENLRFDRLRLFGEVRRIVRALGHRLVAQGALREPGDVFFLEIEEVCRFVEGTSVSRDLKALAMARQAEHARNVRSERPPSRFLTHGVADASDPILDTVATPTPGDSTLRKGLACSPGCVRGRVRIVRDARNAVLSQGDILVAERTDPGWILLFGAAAAVVVERGSLLSHAAIVSRELGIPAVTGLPGATTWLQEGAWVEVDGAAGTVRCLPSDAIEAVA